ncbi:MAG: exosortase/archaeosortase family protein [Fimbriimonas sp.]
MSSPSVTPPEEAAPSPKGFDWTRVVRSPAFWPGLALFLGMVVLYLPLCQSLWTLWMEGDGYYSHGVLVPLISGYIVYRAWPYIKDLPVRPWWLALVPLIGFSWIAYRAGTAGINLIMAACLVASILSAVLFVAGWRWLLALTPATLYLSFAMPFWNSAIDAYTNPLQKLSTKVAFALLGAAGKDRYMSPVDDTTILLNNFTLNIAVPCSGLKLVLALSAFVAFFVLIARLKWWANAILLASILPMALFFNGLRIALIGLVGDAYGEKAGLAFHDWSGFLVLIVCFLALREFARGLGWKD